MNKIEQSMTDTLSVGQVDTAEQNKENEMKEVLKPWNLSAGCSSSREQLRLNGMGSWKMEFVVQYMEM